MKTLTYLCAFAAGVMALGACNKTETAEPENDGKLSTISVKFTNPKVKAVEDPTTGDNDANKQVRIESVTLTLTAASGTETKTLNDKTAGEDNLNDNGIMLDKLEFVFENVIDPQLITVSINGGKKEGMTLAEVVDKGLAEPLYDESNTFEDSGNTDAETGARILNVTLRPEHTVARIEASGITHVDVPAQEGETAKCRFQTLTIDGIFLNEIALTQGAAASTHTTFAAAPAETKIAIGGSFLAAPSAAAPVFPEEGKCYAFNFFGGLPKLIVAFSNATAAQGTSPIDNPLRYAVVSKYKVDGAEVTEFEPGKIYRITELEIADENISGSIEGPEEVFVNATVEVLQWQIKNTQVEWE